MKKILSLFLALLFTAALCACNSDSFKTVTYRDNISCSALIENAAKKIALEDQELILVEEDESLVHINEIKDAIEICDDHCVLFTGGESFDEFGVLHCANTGDAKIVKDKVKAYLKSKQEDDLYRSYFPDEEYKLDETEVKVFGNYVAFVVLSAGNRAAFLAEVESILKET